MKSKRQSLICEIITENEVGTQEELVARLQERGLKVTQATVSRDIRELRLTKAVSDSGTIKYMMPGEEGEAQPPMAKRRFSRVLQEGYLGSDVAGNIVVIHTMVGMANAVAAALDVLHMNEVVGSIAGDDTIFLAVKTKADAEIVLERIAELIS